MMNKLSLQRKGTVLTRWLALGSALMAGSGVLAASSKPVTVVPKWWRFEQEFKSSLAYTNPLQEATLTVSFTSPDGETSQVYGFWDGGKVWRVRFSPDQLGHWTFKTTCSDEANRGLHGQEGEFVCSAALGESRFHRHGLVRVARDRRHFEHADGTPFFWMADAVWSGARVAESKDWELYARVRSSQQFTVSGWNITPGDDVKEQSALVGFPEHIGVNPEFFKRLDARLLTLSRAGILSAICPLSELQPVADAIALPDDQAALVVKYVVARYGAEPVAWLLAFEGDTAGKKVRRWKRIGRDVFAGMRHAPVVLYPGKTAWVLDEFRDQAWVEGFGFQPVADVTEDALKWTFAGPFASAWTWQPPHLLIAFTPSENALGLQSKKRFGAADVRRAAYWGELMAAAAGVSYSGQGVQNWDTTTEQTKENTPGAKLPMWHKALFLPGAKQMGHLVKLMNSVEFWRLQPQPKTLAAQPGDASPGREVVAAGTTGKELGLVYVPEDRTVELTLEALPPSPTITWFDPRSGESSPAVAVVVTSTCQFPTPNQGDWVLVMKAGR
jgi:hypothetical protein